MFVLQHDSLGTHKWDLIGGLPCRLIVVCVEEVVGGNHGVVVVVTKQTVFHVDAVTTFVIATNPLWFWLSNSKVS